MLFIDFDRGLRLRVNGWAEFNENADWLAMFPGSLLAVKAAVEEAQEQNRPVAASGAWGRGAPSPMKCREAILGRRECFALRVTRTAI